MKPEGFMEFYPKEWLDLKVSDRITRLRTINRKYLGNKAEDVKNFMWNFTSAYKRFEMETLDQLCYDLRIQEDKNLEFWTKNQKEFLKDAMFSAYAVNKDDCGEILEDYTGVLYHALEIISEREDRGILAENVLKKYNPVIVDTLIPRGNIRKDGDEEFYAGAREATIEFLSNLDDYANEVDKKIKSLREIRSNGFWHYGRFIMMN